MELKLIGRKEKISLPELGLHLVSAKVDTGAYTSSIHAENIKLVEESGKIVLKFQPLLSGHKAFTGEVVTFENYRKKKVKNSFGHAEIRYLIKTNFQLAGEEYIAEFSLSDRSSMRNAILLGRKILKKRFLVNVSKSNLGKSYLI
jgi:hypothetical protein